MKHFKYLISFLSLLVVLLLSNLTGCGSDSSVNTTNGGGGWPPTFTFRPNSIFSYTTDSISPSGTIIHLNRPSIDTVQSQIQISGQNCFPFRGSTHDAVTNQTTIDLYYVRYDPAGFYYQYGIKRLIDTVEPPTWDLIGDFTKARQTTYSVGTINYTISLPSYGNINFSGPLTGQIADSTVIQTTSNGENIYCYRIELNAQISGTPPSGGQPVTASIFLEYYVGYTTAAYPNNPVGLVELESKPFSFNFGGFPVLAEPGFDRKLYSHNP